MWPILLPVHFVGGFCFAWCVNWMGLRRWRRARDSSWVERARLLWPARVTAAQSVLVVPVILLECQVATMFPFPPPVLPCVLSAFCGFAGALLSKFPFDRCLYPRLAFPAWIRLVLVGWGLRLAIFGSLLGAMLLMPAVPGWPMFGITLGYLALHAGLQFGLILRVLRVTGMLTPADGRLQRIVEETASRLKIQPRRVWVLEMVQVQAFAFIMTRELAFSRRLLEICTDEEVAAICAHELAHLGELPLVRMARFVGSLALFPLIFVHPAAHGLGGAGLALPFLGALTIIVFSRWLGRRMERRADRQATASQAAEGTYARALEKLYRENHLPVVNATKRATHPDLYDRLLAGGITPEYPRPARPRSMTLTGQFLVILMAVGIALLVVGLRMN